MLLASPRSEVAIWGPWFTLGIVERAMVEPAGHIVERCRQLGDFIAPGYLDPAMKVTPGHLQCHCPHLLQRAGHPPGEQEAHRSRQQCCENARPKDQLSAALDGMHDAP
jgi:hypothetical protein